MKIKFSGSTAFSYLFGTIIKLIVHDDDVAGWAPVLSILLISGTTLRLTFVNDDDGSFALKGIKDTVATNAKILLINLFGTPLVNFKKSIVTTINNKILETVTTIQNIPDNTKKAVISKTDEVVTEIQAIPSKVISAAKLKADEVVVEIKSAPKVLADRATKAYESFIYEASLVPSKFIKKFKNYIETKKQKILGTFNSKIDSVKKSVKVAVPDFGGKSDNKAEVPRVVKTNSNPPVGKAAVILPPVPPKVVVPPKAVNTPPVKPSSTLSSSSVTTTTSSKSSTTPAKGGFFSSFGTASSATSTTKTVSTTKEPSKVSPPTTSTTTIKTTAAPTKTVVPTAVKPVVTTTSVKTTPVQVASVSSPKPIVSSSSSGGFFSFGNKKVENTTQTKTSLPTISATKVTTSTPVKITSAAASVKAATVPVRPQSSAPTVVTKSQPPPLSTKPITTTSTTNILTENVRKSLLSAAKQLSTKDINDIESSLQSYIAGNHNKI